MEGEWKILFNSSSQNPRAIYFKIRLCVEEYSTFASISFLEALNFLPGSVLVGNRED